LSENDITVTSCNVTAKHVNGFTRLENLPTYGSTVKKLLGE